MKENEKSVQDNNDALTAFVVKQFDQSEVLPTSNRLPDDDFNKYSLENKLLPPPYDPFKLSILSESSSILNQCIDVMEVNCETFGYEFVPSVDEETFKKLKEEQEKGLGTRQVDLGTRTDKPNAPETEIELEYRRLINFFKYINRTMSYVQIRKRTRRDRELTGNGYWEILRNQLTGKITGIEWLPSNTMRIGRMDKKFTDVMSKRKISDTEIEQMPDKRKFRCYAQIREQGSKPVWYKEFGDPRIMDADTGARAYITRNDRGQVVKVEPVEGERFEGFDTQKFLAGKMRIANEVIHFCNYNSARSLPYGVPRWIGNLISIIGSRASEEINVLYFDNKTVPPGMLLVSGGKITKSAVDRITNHIKDHIKGSKNYHSILVVEAENQPHPNLPAPTIPKLQWVSMKDAQNSDALFQNYDQTNIEKIVSSFRFWPGFVGRVKDINRATADTARKLSEEQVFEPERMEFDSIINRTLLVEMNINYWEHKSKGPQLSTPQDKAALVFQMKDYLTIKEGRELASQVFGKELDEMADDKWVNLTPQMILSLLTDPMARMFALPEAIVTELQGKMDEKEAKDQEQAMREAEIFAAKVQPAAGGGPSNQFPVAKEDVEKFARKLALVKKALEANPEFLDQYMGRK
ncbi:phage portal protein [Lactococcus petauri]